MSSSELLDIALEAARAGAAELVPRYGHTNLLATKSTSTDPVSEADLVRAADKIEAFLS